MSVSIGPLPSGGVLSLLPWLVFAKSKFASSHSHDSLPGSVDSTNGLQLYSNYIIIWNCMNYD